MNGYNDPSNMKNKKSTGTTFKQGGHVSKETSDTGIMASHKSGIKTSKGDTFHAGMGNGSSEVGFKAGGHANIHTGKCDM